MRSSRSGRSKRADPPQFPTAWSEWEWSDQFKCYQRYRLKGPEDYEWDYGQVQSSGVPRTQPSPDPAQLSPGDYHEQTESNYTTASVEVATLAMAQTNLGTSSSSAQQPVFNNKAPWSASSAPSNYIKTKDVFTDREQFDHHYKVHGAWEFKWGRVFKVLWAEPRGDGGDGSAGSGTESVRKGKHGDEYHAKVRRFIIIAVYEGHCICLPIMTYSGQGVKKKGVHAEHHTIIYTEKAIAARGEKDKGLTKKPIKVIPSNPRHKLDNFSRLNYAKTYTVEYNVKVWFIGKVDKASELQLKTDYNRTHPPLDTHGVPSTFDDNTIPEETGDGHNDSGTRYNTYNQNTYSVSTGTFPGSSSVPSSQGAFFPASRYGQGGVQPWTPGQDQNRMNRSNSQPGYYGTAGSSGDTYYPGNQQPIVPDQQWSHPSAPVDSVPVHPEVNEGDRHRRGSVHSSEHEHPSSYNQGEKPKDFVEGEEREHTETEYHQQPPYDPALEDGHHALEEFHEEDDIYNP